MELAFNIIEATNKDCKKDCGQEIIKFTNKFIKNYSKFRKF